MHPGKAFGVLARATLVGALAVLGQIVTAGAVQATASPLSEHIDPTYQTNGAVNAIVTIGTTTYLGGEFTAVRPAGSAPGTDEVPRARLAAVDNTTGALLPWDPGANGSVYALAASPDGQTVYVGGSFGVLGGQAHKKLGAVTAAGGLATAFTADADLKVFALATTGDTVYAGGTFTTINGLPRSRLAALDPTGAVLPAWAPSANGTVRALAIAPAGGSVYAAGEFTAVNGSTAQRYLTKLSPDTGAFQSWAQRPGYPLWSVVASDDAVYVGGNGAGGHASEYSTGGALSWKFQTDGGIQAVHLLDGVLYVGGHFDNVCVGDTDGPTSGFKCPTGQVGVTRHKLVAIVPDPDPVTGLNYRVDDWDPGANTALGVFALADAGAKLDVGGPFTSIGHFQAQEGYAQFSANTAPTAAFTTSCSSSACTFDARSSTDPDGRVVTYGWDLGDGTTATGPTASHTYPAGTAAYSVTLTVTDNEGATGSTTAVVQTTNEAPTARFTVSCPELTCSLDASASSDPDGTITDYAWAFSDGGSTTGSAASYAFAAPGSYTITLTVTDDAAATATSSQQVTASTGQSAISFVGATSVNQNTSTFTVRVPAAVQPGDGLVLVATDNNAATAATPTGWQRAGDRLLTTDGANGTSTVWQRVADATDAGGSVTVRLSGTAKASVMLLAYRGTASTAPLVAEWSAAETVSRAAHTTPGATGIPGGAWVLSYWADKSGTTTSWTAPPGETGRATSIGAAGTTGHIDALLTDSGGPVPAGFRAGLTATADAASNKAAMWTLVLAAAG